MAADNPTRRGTDWTAARDYWLALTPPRSSQRVADQFRVSRARVNYVRKRDGWDAIADDVDRRATEQVKRRIVRNHADRVQKTLGIVDGFLDIVDDQLEAKAEEARLRDVPELVKLANLLVGEATDRMEFTEVQDALGATVKLALDFVPAAHRDEFLGRWRSLFGDSGQEQAA